MSTIFIILSLVLAFAVVIYVVGIKKGESKQSLNQNKEIPPEIEDDEDDNEV